MLTGKKMMAYMNVREKSLITPGLVVVICEPYVLHISGYASCDQLLGKSKTLHLLTKISFNDITCKCKTV